MSSLGRVRGEFGRSWSRFKPSGAELRSASVTSIPLAAAAVPDGMASAALVGVGPIHGIYGGFAGPLIGGLFCSTRRMVVGTTSAASLAAYSALQGVDPADRVPTMVLISVLAGLAMLAAGYAGLGRLATFVSQSVMTGFLTGVALSIVFSQIPDLLGTAAEGETTIARAFNALSDLSQIDAPTTAIGLAAVVLLILGDRSPLGNYAPLVVLVALSIVAEAGDWFDSVAIVRDVSPIDSGFPALASPDLSLINWHVIGGAVSVAVIVLVQGAGVAQAFPNPDGDRANPNGDFSAQGWANVASGMVRGIPVGGSIGSTAMSVSMGARTRWVSVMSGVWMLAVLVGLSGLAERVAMPTLAAILMAASIASINPAMIKLVWRSGPSARLNFATTLIATLVLPIGAAVGLGVALSAVLYIAQQATDIELVQLHAEADGSTGLHRAPTDLASDSITVLAVFGSLFFAAARRLEDLLPRVGSSTGAVVVLRLRGQQRLGATATVVLSRYAAELEAAGGKLVLTEVPHDLAVKLSPDLFGGEGPIALAEASDRLDESTLRTVEQLVAASSPTPAETAMDAPLSSPDPLARRVARLVRGRHVDGESDHVDVDAPPIDSRTRPRE